MQGGMIFKEEKSGGFCCQVPPNPHLKALRLPGI